MRSVTASLSPGMIRIALLGQALQDPTVIDVALSSGSSRKDFERRCSSSGVAEPSDCNLRDHGKGHRSVDEGRDFADDELKDPSDGGRHEEAEERSKSSRRSSPYVSARESEEGERPVEAGSRCSSRRSSSHGPIEEPNTGCGVSPDDTASRHSASRPTSLASSHQQENEMVTADSEPNPTD